MRVMGSQPTHQDVAAAVSQLCYDSIAELEAGLKAQVDSDTAAREEKERAKDRAREEMKKAKDRARMAEEAAKSAAEEAARLVADLEAQEKPRFAQSDNSSAKRVWLDTQDIVDNDDDDDEDHEEEEEEEEEEGNDSAPDDVRILCIH